MIWFSKQENILVSVIQTLDIELKILDFSREEIKKDAPCNHKRLRGFATKTCVETE